MRKFLVVCMVLIGCAAYAQKPYSAQYFQETNPSNLPAINNGLFDSTGWDNPKKATVLALVLPALVLVLVRTKTTQEVTQEITPQNRAAR